ncbi:methyl-accepting chemotaxis protein [Chromobacterium haemolyticum]|uniref:methyl-accepting chemotaxis protein n=1 Tax=Chromobacterium haemolyticum TaxID=394935 RepID=UPI000D30AC4E|nr:methyl-accepting chemotaxis protein [Chromobacterium haemolyticum]PTU70228.1 hypothetical protein DBB33_12615 [Chromobacterium haemolyticum]
MQGLTIRMQLQLLAFGVVVSCLLIGAVGYQSTVHLVRSINELLDSQGAVRRQMDADMMHDAVHGDVLALMLAQKNGDRAALTEIRKDVEEHSKRFLGAMKENQDKISDPEARSLLQQILPVVERYTGAAAAIVAAGFDQPEQAAAKLKDFQQDFALLEDKMEKLADAIDSGSRRQNDSTVAQVGVAAVIIIVAALAAALLMAMLCWWVARSVLPPIERFKDTAQRIERSGDLSIRAQVGRRNELGAAIGEFNTLMDTLQGIVGKVGQTSGALGDSVDEIAQLTQGVEQASRLQTDSAQSMAGAIQQLADHLASVAEHADSTLRIAGEVGQCSSEGSKAVQQTVGNIGNLAQTIHHSANSVQLLEGDIRKIGGMVDAIRGIADQTNLLALNAAIEAARAGESGRGFAVVADEVRALAERTAQATADIVNVISQLQATSEQVVSGMENGVGQVEQGVELVKQLGGMVDQIGRQAGVAEERIRNISRLLDNQKAAGAQILANVDEVTQHAGTTSRSVGQVQDELVQLRGHFGELSESICHMRV